MRSCDEVALRAFFLDRIVEIMTVIEGKLSKVHVYVYVYTYVDVLLRYTYIDVYTI